MIPILKIRFLFLYYVPVLIFDPLDITYNKIELRNARKIGNVDFPNSHLLYNKIECQIRIYSLLNLAASII